MIKRYDKGLIQKSVDDIIETGQYNEEYGKQVLAIVDASVKRRGLYYKYPNDDVDFIIKPKMVDDLLLKVFRYDKNKSSAYTFLVGIMTTAIIDAERKILSSSGNNPIHPNADDDEELFLEREIHKINNDL